MKLIPSGLTLMYFRPKYPQLKNIVFLDSVGEALRWATSDIPKELPDDIRLLLRRLERVERKQQMKKQDDGPLA